MFSNLSRQDLVYRSSRIIMINTDYSKSLTVALIYT